MPPTEITPNPTLVVPFRFAPGIHRDGTLLETEDGSRDGQWVRWFNGRCRKMGGYAASSTTITGPLRNLSLFWRGATGYVHSFSQTLVQRFTINSSGTTSSTTDRTPAGFTNDSNNNWQYDVMYDAASGDASLIAHCTESLADPGSGTSRPVYYGNIVGTSALTSTGKSVTGGVVVLHPYLFAFGDDGEVTWSDANQPTVLDGSTGDSGTARITGSKILRGLPIRGGGTSAQGLFWSLDSLVSAQYVGGTAIFDFQTLSENISVLSSRAIIEYEGRYYWPALDRFMIYDGVVRTLPNHLSTNDFFDNLNYDARQKCWATAVPRFGEIWFHYPRGEATECTNALIFNVHETARTGKPVWYDTEIARSAGSRPRGGFRFPLWADTTSGSGGKTWRHETGVDQEDSGTTGITWYVESANINPFIVNGMNNWCHLNRVDNDATQTGSVTLTVTHREYARSSDAAANTYTIGATDTKEDMQEEGRILRLKIGSSTAGVDWEGGKMFLHLKKGSAQ